MSQDNFRWYTIFVQPKSEDTIAKKMILTAEKKFGDRYAHFFGEVFIPKFTGSSTQGGEKREVKNTAYPGYIFASLNLNDLDARDVIACINSIEGVKSFLTTSSGKPKPLSKKEYEDLIASISVASNQTSSKNSFRIGDIIKLKEGSFKEFDGIITGMSDDKSTFTIKIQVFGRDIEVKVGPDGMERKVL